MVVMVGQGIFHVFLGTIIIVRIYRILVFCHVVEIYRMMNTMAPSLNFTLIFSLSLESPC